MNAQIQNTPLTDVSTIMLLTLYARVLESRSPDPLIRDPKAEEIVAQINPGLLESDSKLLRQLGQFKLRKDVAARAALRAVQFDRYAQEFMHTFPECNVVNLGCGLDTRFWRIDNGAIQFFDLDLPEVIRLKRGLVQESERYRMIGCSVLDPQWLNAALAGGRPTIFLAEGLFMYLPKAEVRELLEALAQRVRTGQLVAEMMHDKYTRGFNQRLASFKFKHELGFDNPPIYRCGITHSRELESWSPRLHYIDDWCYFDVKTPKLGWQRMFGRIPSFRYTQWTIRYRIGE